MQYTSSSSSPPSKKPRVNVDNMEINPVKAELSQRWSSLATIMSRPTAFGGETGPLKFPGIDEFESDPELHEMMTSAKILCVGAGGLGCELLKVGGLMLMRVLVRA